ncbi:hypothetical protein ACWF94_25765 [Streptomyces sp. NPDC055078]
MADDGWLVRELKQQQEAIKGWNREINALKTEVTGVTTALKGIEGSVTAAKAEFTGASAGFKIFNAEKTLFDLETIRENRRLTAGRMHPEDLKQEIADVRRNLGQRITLLRRTLTRTVLRASQDRTAAAAIRTAANDALATARRADTKATRALGRQGAGAAAAGRPGPGQRPVDVRNIREAERAIRTLEGRINRLVTALT